MPHLSRKSKLYIFLFLAAFAGTAAGHLFFPEEFPVNGISSFVFSGIILVWIFTVRSRVTVGWIREYLTMGGFILILLYIIEIVREVYLNGYPVFNRMLFYFYFFPQSFPFLIYHHFLIFAKNFGLQKPNFLNNSYHSFFFFFLLHFLLIFHIY